MDGRLQGNEKVVEKRRIRRYKCDNRDGKAAAAAQEPLRAPSPLLPSLAFGDKVKKHSQDGFKDTGQDKKGAKSGGREAAAQKPRRGLQLFSEVNTSNVRVTRTSLHAFVYILYWTSYVRWRFSYDILYFQVMDANIHLSSYNSYQLSITDTRLSIVG